MVTSEALTVVAAAATGAAATGPAATTGAAVTGAAVSPSLAGVTVLVVSVAVLGSSFFWTGLASRANAGGICDFCTGSDDPLASGLLLFCFIFSMAIDFLV